MKSDDKSIQTHGCSTLNSWDFSKVNIRQGVPINDAHKQFGDITDTACSKVLKHRMIEIVI